VPDFKKARDELESKRAYAPRVVVEDDMEEL
jgi:hypothetical protein